MSEPSESNSDPKTDFQLEDVPRPEPERRRRSVAAANCTVPETRTEGQARAPVDEPLLSERRKRRLLRQVPGFAVGFLLVGWICLGALAWPFALTGAAMGAWAGWSRRGEAVVGSVSAVVGLATWFAVVGFLPGMGMGIVIVGCGIVGFVAGLDDRLRGA